MPFPCNMLKRTIVLIVCAYLSFTQPIFSQSNVESSNHFKLEKLKDGVYAAVHKPGGHAICNAGIIDLGDVTLVIDPFLTPTAANQLKRFAEELTGNPVKYVVNTHYHSDHIRGNQVFENATIISTEKTKDLIEKRGAQELEEDRNHANEHLMSWRNKSIDKNNLSAVENQRGMIGYYEGIVQSLPAIKITSPHITFKESLTIRGSQRSVEIMEMGFGHTESDAVIWIESEQLLFAGDLLFVGAHPWMLDGDPENWFRILDRLMELKPEAIVPGHGPVTTSEAVRPMKNYMRAVLAAADQYAKHPDMDMACPEPYNQWMLSGFYAANVIGLSKRKVVPVPIEFKSEK